MSNRGRGGNRVRGPHSALTDYLAANNISAAQIRDDYEARVAQAAQDAPQQDRDDVAAEVAADMVAEEDARAGEPGPSSSKKRKRGDVKVDVKVKKGKSKHQKKKRADSDSDDDDSEYDDALGRAMYKKSQPLPGQLENCEICNKRFTVTPYSKTGPDGGLLCTPCGKELAKESMQDKKVKKGSRGKKRRNVESERLDGRVSRGAKSLVQLCLEKVAQYHDDVEELGEMPDNLSRRLTEIFSKKRVLNPATLNLFLRPDLEKIILPDCAYLETEDYDKIFAVAPNLQVVEFTNACQFKDQNMDYMLEKASQIKHLQLHAANLVTDPMWLQLFARRGANLQTLELMWLDASFDDDVVKEMVTACANLTRLKLKRCRRIGSDAVDAISKLSNLQHLSLQMSQEVDSDRLVNLVGCIGAKLQTLSLESFSLAEDFLLEAIHNQCRSLKKLRLADNYAWTDAGFAALFAQWQNPPLLHADMNTTRDVDNSNPDGPEEATGFGSEGLKALMAHSGSKLERLNIESCRHIKHLAFSEVFDGKEYYPNLKEIDISFCRDVDTFTVAGIFKSCPALTKLTAFGCFNIKDVIVPAGIVLIGVPNAQDAIEQFGDVQVSHRRAQLAYDTVMQDEFERSPNEHDASEEDTLRRDYVDQASIASDASEHGASEQDHSKENGLAYLAENWWLVGPML